MGKENPYARTDAERYVVSFFVPDVARFPKVGDGYTARDIVRAANTVADRVKMDIDYRMGHVADGEKLWTWLVNVYLHFRDAANREHEREEEKRAAQNS